MNATKFLFPIWICFLAVQNSNAQEVFFEHTGATNPIMEGWEVLGSGVGVTTGPVFNDLGTGLDAWSVEDSLTSGGSFTQYSQSPSPMINATAQTLGWKLSVRLRMVESSIGTFEGMFADYRNGTTGFLATFDRESDGDPTVRLEGGSSFTLEGAGDDVFHRYDLIYDANAASADLFVDGIEVISDYTGVATTSNRVAWGANGSDATGRGHFNLVSFSAVPEPNSLLLCAACGLVFSLTRRKQAI